MIQEHDFGVYSPSYTVGGYYDPPEDVVDWVEVRAPTAREAIRRALPEMLRQFPRGWCAENRADGSPPWKGLKVERLPEHDGAFDEEYGESFCVRCGDRYPCKDALGA